MSQGACCICTGDSLKFLQQSSTPLNMTVLLFQPEPERNSSYAMWGYIIFAMSSWDSIQLLGSALHCLVHHMSCLALIENAEC